MYNTLIPETILGAVIFKIRLYEKYTIINSEDIYGIFLNIKNGELFNSKKYNFEERKYDFNSEYFSLLGTEKLLSYYMVTEDIFTVEPVRDVLPRYDGLCDFSEMLSEESILENSTFYQGLYSMYNDVKTKFKPDDCRIGGVLIQEFVFLIEELDQYDPYYVYKNIFDINKGIDRLYRKQIESENKEMFDIQHEKDDEYFNQLINK